MNRPAVFFDRDNTLIACDGYLGDPDKVVLVDGAADAVARVRELGFSAVVFSNQSGVARGMFPEEAVHAVNHRLDDLLHEENPRATIDRHDFCPYHPTAKVERYRQDSDLRKPKPGMIYQAASVLNLDLKRSWVVGDAPRDIAAGQTAGLRTVLLKIASLPPSPATNEGAGAAPDYVATSLKDAIDFIERNLDLPAAAPQASAPVETSPIEATPAVTVPAAEPAQAAVHDAWTSSGSTGTTSTAATRNANPPAAKPSPAAAEEPVKPTPPSKPTLTIRPAASRSEPRPDTSKQGGFVVKPNQPPPTGMTWGERMRVAKGGSPLATAVSAARPEIPRPSVTQSPSTVESSAAVAESPEAETSRPAREVIMRTIPAPAPAVVPTPAEATPVEPPTEAVAPSEPQASRPAAAPEPEPVASEPAIEPEAAAPVVAETAQSTIAETVEVATPDPAPVETQAEPVVAATSTASVASPEPNTTTADTTPAEPRRGLRREDLEERVEPANTRSETRSPAGSVGDPSRVEALLEQILIELRRREDASANDFSVPKLIAGITQVLALAALFISYLNKDTYSFQPTVLVAIALQTLTISLLIMGKQR